MLLLPGSHREGVVERASDGDAPPAGYEGQPAWVSNLTARLKYGLDRACVARLVSAYGIVAPKGPAGAVLMLHGNVVHGSAGNMSPLDRATALVTFNSVENMVHPVATPRPEFLASRDYAPVEIDAAECVPAASGAERER